MEKAGSEGIIQVRLLGEFSFLAPGWEEWRRVEVGRAGLLWSIIAYLIVNRGRSVSTDQLIETFWPEDSTGDPDSILRHAIHRSRALLEKLGFADAKELILTAGGGYAWNTARNTKVDCEQFEAAYQRLRTLPEGGERTELMLEALRLYRGDFWTVAKGVWGSSLQIYYRSVYTDLAVETTATLREDERWSDIIDVCTRAVVIDPTAEELSAALMQALTALKRPEKALEHYVAIKEVLQKEYGVEPSDAVELARAEAEGAREGRAISPEDMLERLRSTGDSKGAYMCEYPVFARIASLEARQAARSGKDVPLVMIKVRLPEAENAENARSSTDMKRMERTLLGALRTSDPFTRLSSTQFLLMLPDAGRDNVPTVMARIESRFRRNYPYSKAEIRFEVFSVNELLRPGDE